MRPNLEHNRIPEVQDDMTRFDAIQGTRAAVTSDFWRVHFAEKVNGAWSWLRGQDNHLHSLSEEVGSATIRARHHVGVRTVPIDRIDCSEGRSKDFDAQFRPASTHTKDRWVGVGAAREMGATLPPVDLIQIGERFCVRDGNHRISVARAFGQKEIDAQIIVWEPEAADREPLKNESPAN